MIVGHERNLAYLSRVLQSGRVAHAYLFHGPEGVGKKAVALEFFKSLLCNKRAGVWGGCLPDRPAPPRGEQAGGECEDCRMVVRMHHPDLMILSRETLLVPDDEKRAIGIKNIHELRRRLGLGSWRGGAKGIIVDGAEHLSRDAQSALLKILEEPQPRTVFVLITSTPDALFATIRSRSVPMGFGFVSESAMAPLLAGVPQARQRAMYSLAAGRAGVLSRLAGDKKFFEDEITRDKQLRQLLTSDLATQFAFSDTKAREAGELESLFGFLFAELRRTLHEKISARESHAPALAPAIELTAAFLSRLLASTAILETTALNRRLLADSTFFELSGIAQP